LVASVCGFIGGILGFLASRAIGAAGSSSWNTDTVGIARMHAYELMDSKGRTRGRWSLDKNERVALTLLDENGNRAAELGVGNEQKSLIFFKGAGSWIQMSLVTGLAELRHCILETTSGRAA